MMTDAIGTSTPTLLAEKLRSINVPASVDSYDCVIISMFPIFVWITKRPWYCDRGRWQVNCETRDPIKLCIDAADAFPRYYFHEDALTAELATFLTVRLRNMRNKQQNANTQQSKGGTVEREHEP